MEKKMVRPYMTAEARDALNGMCNEINKDSIFVTNRSDSIVMFFNDALRLSNLADNFDKEVESLIEKESKLKLDLSYKSSELMFERKKNKEWKVYCAVLFCTTIASLVALAIQAA